MRWTQHAVHAGPLSTPFGTIPPTGRQIPLTGMIIFRIVDGKITDEWENCDTLGMLQQLGVVPSAEWGAHRQLGNLFVRAGAIAYHRPVARPRARRGIDV